MDGFFSARSVVKRTTTAGFDVTSRSSGTLPIDCLPALKSLYCSCQRNPLSVAAVIRHG
ncbi:hypothetical protein PILCRDRAFT_249156 [Piloderma croceum F 1598]|uniref:Uncharacterized protein n=1 Tax=Piloderma croceum (strain F 1598) TaxID=765440 RepID=A0A0C3G8U5_PILCF|nr:hypothetical protein PILCRDRAFT_249156 [Piloderma croceum F 1598]